jgi:hypothetical protein
VPARLLSVWRYLSTRLPCHHVERDREDWPNGEERNYDVVDGITIREQMPSLYGFYSATATVVSLILGREVVVSPYAISAVNLNIMRAPRSAQGWHPDTNGITGLIYLTTHIDEGLLEIRCLDGVQRVVKPRAGALLVMLGRQVPHRVTEYNNADSPRIAVPLNYYEPDDLRRPAELDQVLYA